MTADLAQHATRAPVPETASDRLRMLAVDYLSLARAGSRAPSAIAAVAAVSDDAGSAHIEGSQARVPAEAAALVNGISAHGLELDDTHEESSTHPGVVIWPTVFALADLDSISVDEALAAANVGYDVMTSSGVLIGAAEVYRRGFHPTAVAGALGAAAAASRLLELDVEQTQNALSLSANLAAGSLQFLTDGAWTKRLNAGHAASAGIRAARLARAGFRAPAAAIEGDHGWLRLYGGGMSAGNELDLCAGRGVLSTSVKFFACCRYMHGAMDLLADLHMSLGHLTSDEIARIDVAVIEAGQALVSLPPAQKLSVASTVDAQFNMPFGAALAFTTGRAGLEDFDNAASVAERLAPWMSKIHTVTSAKVEAAYPSRWTAEVRVLLDDGQEIARTTESFRGSPSSPPNWEDIAEKAAELVGPDSARALVKRWRHADGDAPLSSVKLDSAS
ncbi:MmgE/PrpD family protein [Microbacterium lacus]|uniref:MmgE/PrpD family protein n=1 Tax=Microbacterium lacus TaxID=415217 RepID=A0ABP4TA74_9MICO